MLGKALTTAAAGNAGAGGLVIEDVFSTWLYTGTGAAQTITNGIDLAGEGGLVWIKSRSNASTSHALVDTARGATKQISSNTTAAQTTTSSGGTDYNVKAFNNDGFSLGGDWDTFVNGSTYTYASWTFRKAPGFFDVVTYAGTGGSRTINHNLGSVPGCVIVKRTDSTSDWLVWHRSAPGAGSYTLVLNKTDEAGLGYYNDINTVGATTFNVSSTLNASGATYVAYLFAHDEQIFGDAGDQSVIKCGSFTTNGSGHATVDLGWEPQWLLCKGSSFTGNWELVDTMRGLTQNNLGAGTVNNALLFPNLSDAESGFPTFGITSTGFLTGANLGASRTFIYIAIRRGPMKTPESGTEVFAVSSPTTGTYTTTTNFPIDSAIVKSESTVADWYMMSRLTGNAKYLNTNTTAAESTIAGAFNIDSNTSFTQNLVVTNPLNYIFRRAPGFFDVVAYNGNTSVAQNVSHSLGVAPELMIFKVRSGGINGWYVYHKDEGVTKYVQLQTNASSTTSANWLNNTAPTDSVFSLGTYEANWQTYPHIAYLFATLPGISKVDSYTGTGTTLSIDCGFTAGARFVLIKRTDSTGDWYVWDTARGISSGNDPYLLLNSTAAENTSTDYIDPLSSGFQISSTAPAAINANGGSFIFLAIA